MGVRWWCPLRPKRPSIARMPSGFRPASGNCGGGAVASRGSFFGGGGAAQHGADTSRQRRQRRTIANSRHTPHTPCPPPPPHPPHTPTPTQTHTHTQTTHTHPHSHTGKRCAHLVHEVLHGVLVKRERVHKVLVVAPDAQLVAAAALAGARLQVAWQRRGARARVRVCACVCVCVVLACECDQRCQPCHDARSRRLPPRPLPPAPHTRTHAHTHNARAALRT
jgi:hypothetical protein